MSFLDGVMGDPQHDMDVDMNTGGDCLEEDVKLSITEPIDNLVGHFHLYVTI
jgi:hypothetical protein